MSENRVFVVQRPAYYCTTKQGWVNKYDLNPATEHGELIFLLRPGNIYKDKLESAILRLREMLADYTCADHILAIGDPVAIAAAVMVASEQTDGIVSLLKYDRKNQRYDAYKVDIQ